MNDHKLQEMSFMEHVIALKSSLTRSVIAVLITSTICLYWSADIFTFITSPLRENFTTFDIIGTGPAEAFIIKLQLSIIAGLLTSSPFCFYQLWRFISPGLYAKEKKLAIPFVLISSILFLGGVSFCFKMMFPYAFQYFYSEYEALGIHPSIKVDEYLNFTIRMLLVFGIVFETPVVCYFLARFGLVNAPMLIKNGRYAVVAIFIIAAILTPPDVVSQLLLAAPLLVIYALCIGICYFVNPKKDIS